MLRTQKKIDHSGKIDQSGKRRAAFASLLAALLAMAASAASAQESEGTPEQRAACTPDAMHLCNAFIPDAARVKECLVQHIDGLSPACREVFENAQKPASEPAGRPKPKDQ